ncbi:protoporphyrinogen/coproporphyrinogen oxidase [Dactylosporangium siamense]|nr:FAD-dependent oxidoreductase [Dactylosporangium siamense]
MRESPGSPVIVLGAGLAGLATALHLRDIPVVLVERDSMVGGKARSHRRDGFTFDVTGHWLHLKHQTTQDLVQGLLEPGALIEAQRRTTIYTHGVMLPYPFQANLHGLPLAVMGQCLAGFIGAWLRTRSGKVIEPRDFEDYVVRRFGRGMARHFFIPYYSKYWGMSLNELASDWHVNYVPVPTLRQVLSGAVGSRQDGLGYNARFLYPAAGGIDMIPQAMHRACTALDTCTTQLSTSVEEIDPRLRRIRLTSSPDWVTWHSLVSTIPLPDLLDRIPALPPEVMAARGALRSLPLRYLNVATRTRSPMREHWVYVPDPGFPFYRVGTFSNAVAAMAPPGCAGLWVELSDHSGRVDIPDALRALARLGAITDVEDVLFVEQHEVEHSYVIFDSARKAAVHTIQSWLAEHDIHICGRYGAWAYGSMEDAIVDGIAAARRIHTRHPAGGS